MTTIKNAVIALVFVMLCAGLAFAAIPPLDGLMTPPSIVSSTVTGKAVRALSGKLCVAASSATAGTCTTSIDGTLGINSTKQITASSATFSSSTVTGTGTFNKITVTGATSLSGATASGNITASSFSVSGIGVYTPRINLYNNSVVISSESTASLGGGVRVSSNVYIVGFSSASKYYGDGTTLGGVATSAQLSSIASLLSAVVISTGAEAAARIAADLLLIPSSATGNYALRAATSTYLATAPGTCGAGEFITGMSADGTKTCATPAGGGDVVLASTQTFTGQNTFTSSVTLPTRDKIVFGNQLLNSTYTATMTETAYTDSAWGPCVTGSTLTIVTQAGFVELHFMAQISMTGSTYHAGLAIVKDGAIIGNDIMATVECNGTNFHQQAIINWIEPVTAGTHTFCVQVYGQSGNTAYIPSSHGDNSTYNPGMSQFSVKELR